MDIGSNLAPQRCAPIGRTAAPECTPVVQTYPRGYGSLFRCKFGVCISFCRFVVHVFASRWRRHRRSAVVACCEHMLWPLPTPGWISTSAHEVFVPPTCPCVFFLLAEFGWACRVFVSKTLFSGAVRREHMRGCMVRAGGEWLVTAFYNCVPKEIKRGDGLDVAGVPTCVRSHNPILWNAVFSFPLPRLGSTRHIHAASSTPFEIHCPPFLTRRVCTTRSHKEPPPPQ